uniref:RxLR effector candidate protein n=1 Tax=Hyaloperonospora arabidopsidis (strain Emoy2) TaxID=559515 RepID=M4BJA6_HYAAE
MQRILLAVALFNITTRAHVEVGLPRSQKQVALLLDTTDTAVYVVVSCKMGEAPCVHQCAEVWCASDVVGYCPITSRQVIQVADRCATCKHGALSMPRADVEQHSGTVPDSQWMSVHWRYADCESKSGSSVGSNDMQVSDETTRFAGDIRAYLTSTFEEAIKEPIREGVLHYFAPGDDETEGIPDALFEPSRVDNDSGSKSDRTSNSDDILNLLRGSRSTASLYESSSSSSSTSDALTPPLSSPLIFPLASSTFDRVSSRGESSSTSASSGTVNEDFSYSVGTVTPAMDSLPGSSSSDFLRATDQLPTPRTVPSEEAPHYSDETSMATSSVTNSPFFYAAILLGIVGFIGVVAGHRAEQKRSDRNERRAFQRSAGTVIPTCTSRPALLSRTTCDSHNIAIL